MLPYLPIPSCCPFLFVECHAQALQLDLNSIPLLDTFIFPSFHPCCLCFSDSSLWAGNKHSGRLLWRQGIYHVPAGVAGLFMSVFIKTTSQELGKVLQWSIALILLFTLAPNGKDITLSRVCREQKQGRTEIHGNFSYLAISILVLQVLILKYSVWQMIKRPWWGLLAASACAGILISGFRSSIAIILLLFFIVSLLYKRWFVSIVAPILGLAMLMLLSSSKTLLELPFGVQRILSVLPFLEVSSQAREDAMAPSNGEWKCGNGPWMTGKYSFKIKYSAMDSPATSISSKQTFTKKHTISLIPTRYLSPGTDYGIAVRYLLFRQLDM